MMNRRRFLALSALAAAAPARAQNAAFLAECARRGALPDYAQKGEDGWLFLTAELKHLAVGTFWEPEPPLVGKLKTFVADLTAKGVSYLAAIVPARAAIFPEKIVAGSTADTVPPRKPLHALLQSAGVPSVDLDALFRGKRDGMFCRTDAHWSPSGAAAAAAAIFDAVKNLDSVKPLLRPGTFKTAAPAKLSIEGDLTQAAGTKGTPPEELETTPAGKGNGTEPVPADPKSPVILMGDSHTMVFTDGRSANMHCDGAGLRDHLQVHFGIPLAQISSQNSGTRGAQRILAQRALADPVWWSGRKLLIQVFSEREFTAVK